MISSGSGLFITTKVSYGTPGFLLPPYVLSLRASRQLEYQCHLIRKWSIILYLSSLRHSRAASPAIIHITTRLYTVRLLKSSNQEVVYSTLSSVFPALLPPSPATHSLATCLHVCRRTHYVQANRRVDGGEVPDLAREGVVRSIRGAVLQRTSLRTQ